eukprot:TRINITY_DN18331_c0_g1_i2.p1 TRINITY_DN18331_c0_g1~~TRINITY_DN18331_c0_g1_i2.p1  ORF type:complete len:431 (-),score=67.97 TRINITY_DN18331_c0_g1_i2:154-1446(-)
MALLSMAHVTFGDAVGESNKTLLMQLVRGDGLLLKPDRPATAIDRQFQAMVFGSWPGQGPVPSPGELSVAPCGSSNHQSWKRNTTLESLSLAVDGACLDISGCSKQAGAQVKLYYGHEGFVCGKPGQPGACSAQNERWEFVPSNSTVDPFSLVRSTWSGLCLRVENGIGAVTAECDPSDSHQQWVPQRAQDDTMTLSTPIHDDEMCLTGEPHALNWHGFSSPVGLESEAARLFPADSGISRNVARAYTISATWLRKAEAQQAKDECVDRDECPRGVGAPQGPLGEVYSTHSTISNLTWRFVVGVQLSEGFNVTVHDLGMSGAAAGTHVTYGWDDATSFHPDTAEQVKPFDHTHPLVLHLSTGVPCATGVGVMNITTDCFPIQWHAVAPRLSDGWVLLGEVGKFIPISSQRLHGIAQIPGGGIQLLSLIHI